MIADERTLKALTFDVKQAVQIVSFLSQGLRGDAKTFRLMPHVFPDSLDLTSFDSDGNELDHVHPRRAP